MAAGRRWGGGPCSGNVNEGDKVINNPIRSDLAVVKWSTQRVETTSAVEVMETQGILRWREREREREREDQSDQSLVLQTFITDSGRM